MIRCWALSAAALLVGCAGSNASVASSPSKLVLGHISRSAPASRTTPTPQPTADWPTFDGNPSRAAWLRNDTSLNRQNVALLRRHWVTTLNTKADSTPIYVAHPAGLSGKVGPMLFQTDFAGTTYGIDAASGHIVWRFATVGTKHTQSTPVLDPSGTAIYVPGVDGYVRKLDAATGTQLSAPGFPAQISLIPQTEENSSPLTVANGYLYATTSGFIGDRPPYIGRVVAVRLSDGTTTVFNSLCSNLHTLLTGSQCPSQRSGSWSRSGVIVDPDSSMNGRIYFTTGNGTFDPSQNDYADSVIALSPDGFTLADSFTPADYEHLQQNDLDLSSTAPVMLPRIAQSSTPLMAVQGGKEGLLYLLDRTRLGGVGGQLQQIQLSHPVFSAPAVWLDPSGATWIFFGRKGGMTGWTLATNASGRSQLEQVWNATVGGSSPVAINGLVIMANNGAVYALDAQNGSLLWSSKPRSAGGSIGSIHWESPIAVNGAVYISDGAGHLTAFTINGS